MNIVSLLIGLFVGVLISFILVRLFGDRVNNPQAVLHIDASDDDVDKYMFEFLVAPDEIKASSSIKVDIDILSQNKQTL